MAADGSIVIDVDLDNKKAQQELNKLNKKIESLNDQIYIKQQQQMPLIEQSRQLGAELDAAKAKLESMRSGGEFFPSSSINQQAEKVKQLQKEWDAVQKKVESYDASIEKTNIALNLTKERAGDIQKQLATSGPNTEIMSQAMERMQKSAGKFSMRLREVVRSALIFTVISRALASLREWFGKVVKTNDEATAAIGRLKGALLTLVQPLVNVIIPAFTTFVNVLSRIIAAIANVVSMLFGSTIKQSAQAAEGLNKEAEALEGVGAAADEASGSLAGFDEINQLAGESKGGGGGTGSDTIAPTFDFEEQDTGILDKILNLVKLIGTALLYWKLPKQFRGGLKTILGLFLAIDGAIEFIRNTFDAWVNGVTWDNLLGMLLRAAELVTGLWLVFGKTGAAIGLIVTGLTMLVTGLHDAYENGWNLQNLILSIAGILATGVGIALLTGTWIPLLIAGITSILLALTVATGHGEELINGLKTVLDGFLQFFKGIFSGDIETAIGGIEKIFEGLGAAVSAVIDGLRDTFLGFLDWLDEKTGGYLSGIIESIKTIISGAFNSIKETILNVIEAAKQVLTGLVQFISGVFTQDWNMAWEGVKNIFKGAWNGVVSLLEGAVNIIIRGLNWLISQMNKISFDIPSWVPGVGGKNFGINIPKITEFQIPRLAAGAVIPPNREFLAVLGDQRSGTNIEAPLDTIQQALVQAMREIGITSGGTQTINLVVDGRTLAKVIVPQINRMTQQAGKPVLNF